MTSIDETISSGSAGGSATACVECFAYLGLDPQLAALFAIVLGVLVRLAVDVVREKRRETQASP